MEFIFKTSFLGVFFVSSQDSAVINKIFITKTNLSIMWHDKEITRQQNKNSTIIPIHILVDLYLMLLVPA